jgi:hypothetical protein
MNQMRIIVTRKLGRKNIDEIRVGLSGDNEIICKKADKKIF